MPFYLSLPEKEAFERVVKFTGFIFPKFKVDHKYIYWIYWILAVYCIKWCTLPRKTTNSAEVIKKHE